MSEISAITIQKNNKKRANIFIDGHYFCSLEAFTVLSGGLKVGEEIDPDRIALLQLQSESGAAFDKAIKYISVRLRSSVEIEKYLAQKGYLPQIIAQVLSKLAEYGYINDEVFTDSYIATYRHKYGTLKLRQELKRFGVDEELIEKKLDEMDSQAADIRSLYEKFIRIHGEDADKNKFIRQALSKGFAFDDIKEAIENFKDEE